MVFAVQCPEPRCRKFMLVEEHDRGQIVLCLICKTPIRVGAEPGAGVRDTRLSDQTRLRPGDDPAVSG